MARLILINGAPGSGKSTLARTYVDDHPLALALDIDTVRAMLGRWLDEPTEAGLIARRIALEMARVQLAAGREVVVPQFLGRLEFVFALDRLCHDVGAEFVELALLSSPQEAVDRFVRRSANSETAEHRDAQHLLDRSGGIDALPGLYDRLLKVLANRPRTRTVVTVDGQVARAYPRSPEPGRLHMNEPHNRRRPKRLLTGSRTATGDQWMPRQPYPRSPQADPAASVEDALADMEGSLVKGHGEAPTGLVVWSAPRASSVGAAGVRVMATRGLTDIRGLATAERCCTAGAGPPV